jgi:cell division protein YceG involved in septum cleavage
MNGLPGIKNKILNADPTVIYANDTVQLDALEFERWQDYRFWVVPEVPLRDVPLPDELLGYQTYTQPGLIPGPISTPTLPSIDAALHPDTSDEYIYFLAIPDSGGKHAFAKTAKEHNENRRKYGYIQ